MADLIALGVGRSAALAPVWGAWWLWCRSSKRLVDRIDTLALVPVGWILNFIGVAILGGSLF